MNLARVRTLTLALVFACSGSVSAQTVDSEEPPADSVEPAAAPAEPESPPAAARVAATPEVTYAAGTRLRGIFVPAWFLEAFTHHAHSLSSASWGFDFTRRKRNLDIVFGLDIGWYGNIPDANWTGNQGSDPFPGDTYWTRFDGFEFVSLDVSALWHHDFNEWFALRYGGGIGIGFLIGDMYRQKSGPNCLAGTVDDTTRCYPGGLGDAEFKEDLSSYRVLPVVASIIGARFKLHRHAVVTVEGGFHNAFFFGASGQYVF